MPDYRPMATHLETDRLTLRPVTPADASEYQALVAERGDGLPLLDEIRARIVSQVAATAENGIALLPVVRRVEGDLIGYCGLVIGRCTLDEPELAYELYRRVHGHGYATEAARAVVDAATATGRNRLWATIRSWNAASLRVVEKLGFVHDHSTTDERGDVLWFTRAL
jgi:RimJ/RimL family protein N-acetyltransferase